MTTQARAVETRRAIVHAAAEAFGEQGFERASLADIARRAGVTKGALYFHFASKNDLADAMIVAQADANADVERLVADYAGDRKALLVEMTTVLAARLRTDATLRAAMRLAVERGDAENAGIAQTYLAWQRSVSDVVRSGVARGEIAATVDADGFARLLVGAFTGLQTVSLVTSGLDDLDARLTDLWRYLEPALRP